MLTTVWGLLWRSGKALLGAKHPPEPGSALQQQQWPCPAVPLLSLCTDMTPAAEQKPATFVPSLLPPPCPSQPILALHVPSCRGAQQPCPAPLLAFGSSSPQPCQGCRSHWVVHKKEFLLPAGRHWGVPWAGLTLQVLLWALLAVTCPPHLFWGLHSYTDTKPELAVMPAPSSCRQCQQDSWSPGFPLLPASPASQVPQG